MRVWIDVGSHLGEHTFEEAKSNWDLIVYAFEPNISVSSKLFNVLSNFIVIPMAVSERNGFVEFNLNEYAASSSLLSYDEHGAEHWKSPPGSSHRTISRVLVPSIRLDTFMDAMKIDHVDFLKVDAEGYDFYVLKSAGDRLKDVERLRVEVQKKPLFVGAKGKAAVVGFLKGQGFILVHSREQSYGQEEHLVFEKEG